MNVELSFYLTICIFLLITVHFLGAIENIQENAGQLKNTTKETGQDVRQIKDDVTKIKGWHPFFSFFHAETRLLNYQQKLKGVQDMAQLVDTEAKLSLELFKTKK